MYIKYRKKLSGTLIVCGLLLLCYMLGSAIETMYFKKQKESKYADKVKQYSESYHLKQASSPSSVDKNHIHDIKLPDGNPVLRIVIPKLKIDEILSNGTSKTNLKLGPCMYDQSPLPWQENANVCIAAHRTTYGAAFRNINTLAPGDNVIIKAPGIDFIYSIVKVFTVNKNDWSITKKSDYAAVTLTSCHPPGSAKFRIVARGKLIDVLSH